MAEAQTTDDNVSATGQQHTEQPEFNNEGKVDQNAEQCHDICPLLAKLTGEPDVNRTRKPYNYTYQNSLYETFKPPSKAYLDQLDRAKEVRKTMWRKTFVRTKPNIAKNVGFH
ncbi:hypothetical protein Tco_0229607 [Tanacetum coccineum]